MDVAVTQEYAKPQTSHIEAQEFWKWAFSDFLSNALRGVLAEYIVGQALGCAKKPRTEWTAYDLITDAGLKVEVKSSAYLQSWKQKRPSVIQFGIGRKQAWDSETNTSSAKAVRSADIYVFCVFTATDRALADPLDLDQWFFLVCPTAVLDEKCGSQKSIGLSSLEHLGLDRLSYWQLCIAIRAAGANISLSGEA